MIRSFLGLVLAVSFAATAHAEWVITQLTNDAYDDGQPKISGSNVVWVDRRDAGYSDVQIVELVSAALTALMFGRFSVVLNLGE